MMRLACFACAAGLARGFVLSPSDPADTITEAINKLEHMWPHSAVVTAAMQEARENHEGGIPLRRKLREAMRGKRAFVFAAFGSSKSAGHDNMKNQSWPFELERLLKPTFQQLGFDFEMRQRAAGGYGETPFQAGCMQSRAGEVDALSWEFQTFRDAPCEGKHFLDEASAIRSEPVVFAFTDENLDFDSLTTPGAARKEARNRLLRNGDDVAFEGGKRQYFPNEWYFGEEFVSSDEVNAWTVGSHVGSANGYSGGHRQYLRQTGAAAAFEATGRGFYPVTVSAASGGVVGLPWYQAREKAFNINWHPGPLGHTLIASQVAHYILGELRTAVLHPEPERRGPGPTADNPLVGKGPGTDFSGSGLRCGHLRTQQCFTGLEPHNGKGLETLASTDGGQWEFIESRQSVHAPGNLGSTVDARMAFHGNSSSGELKLTVDIQADDQYAILCGAPCGWWCQGPAGYVSSKATRWWNDDTWKGFVNDQPSQVMIKNLVKQGPRPQVSDLTFAVDGRTLNEDELRSMHEELYGSRGTFCPGCQNPGELCQPVASLKQGKHTLSVRVTPRTMDVNQFPKFFVEVLQLMVVG